MGNLFASLFSLCRVLRIWHSTLYSMVLTMVISERTAWRSFSRREGSQEACMTSARASKASPTILPLPAEPPEKAEEL